MKLLIFTVALILAERASADYSPCFGRSNLGGECDSNADCAPTASVCLRGRCRCHPHYIEVVDEKGNNPHCQLIPAKIGAPCTTKCREPLFCRNGGCQCVQRGTTTLVNGECISVSRVGDRCTRHYDCTSPFSACLNQQCVCISGTVQQGAQCVATANCPFGGLPGATCILKSVPGAAWNLPPERAQSNCPGGQVCITAEDSAIGHCCPVVCPLASHVDTKYSCDPTARNETACPSDTHFCHLLSDSRFSQAVCCRRPCNAMAPNALYANNQCLPRGQLNSECSTNAQCGGGEAMECVKIFEASGDGDEEQDEEIKMADESARLEREIEELEAELRHELLDQDDADVPRKKPSKKQAQAVADKEDDDLLNHRRKRSPDTPDPIWNPFLDLFKPPKPAKEPVKTAVKQEASTPKMLSTSARESPLRSVVIVPATTPSPTTNPPKKAKKAAVFVGQCACLRGFTPSIESLTHPVKNPSQTCTRECSTMDLARDTSCFKTVSLGGQCFVQKQCPSNSGCYRGRCMCKCGFELKRGKCVPLPPPPTTTSAPSVPIVPGIPPGGDLFKLFGQFFGGGAGGGSPFGG